MSVLDVVSLSSQYRLPPSYTAPELLENHDEECTELPLTSSTGRSLGTTARVNLSVGSTGSGRIGNCSPAQPPEAALPMI